MLDLTSKEIEAVLKAVPDGVLALTDGTKPYCIPFGYVYTNDIVYLSLFPKGRKWEMLQNNPRAN